jgi:hypothetical protein
MFLVDACTTFLRVVTTHLDLFGLLGLGFGFLTGLMPHRGLILLSSAACSLCFSLHFYGLGSPTGMAMNLIGLVQSLLAARFVAADGRPAWLDAVFALTFLLAAALTVATWNGLPSIFAGIATLVSTAARLQSSSQTMRLLLIGSACGWASHNLLVGSVCGLTCDCLGIAGFIAAALREQGWRRSARYAGLRSS